MLAGRKLGEEEGAVTPLAVAMIYVRVGEEKKVGVYLEKKGVLVEGKQTALFQSEN